LPDQEIISSYFKHPLPFLLLIAIFVDTVALEVEHLLMPF